MPGRHGKQVRKKKKSKRQRPTEMETTLKDSIHNRTRKERSILKELIPPKPKLLVRKVASKVSVSRFLPAALAQKLVDAKPKPVSQPAPQVEEKKKSRSGKKSKK